jgi:di/tricarboxylate transporter
VLKDIVPKDKVLALLVVVVIAEIGTEVDKFYLSLFAFVLKLWDGLIKFMSNTSMATILLPIADSLARENGINPTYFLVSLTVCVSLAFMLPVATATNAVVFSSGYIKIPDMVFQLL